MKDLIVRLAGCYGKRYTRNQKIRFLNYLSREFESMGYKTGVYSQKSLFKNKLIHMAAGDMQTAEVLFVTSYDTPSRIIWPGYTYFPLKRERDQKYNVWNGVLGLLVFLLICAAYYRFVFPMFGQAAAAGRRILAGLFTFLTVLFTSRIISGFPNKYNFTRNTASLAVCLKIAEQAGKQQAAFLFTDMTVSSNEGLKILQEQLGSVLQRKRVIFFDCIGKGDIFAAGSCEETRAEAGRFMACFEPGTIQRLPIQGTFKELFPKAFILTRGILKDDDVIVKNTRSGKDCELDFEALEEAVNACLLYLKEKGAKI